MSALPTLPVSEERVLAGPVLLTRVVMPRPVTEDEFWELCQKNPELRVERGPEGELLIMAPLGLDGSANESDVFFELQMWAKRDGQGRAYGPNTGITLPDTSVRAPDACWLSWERLNALDPEDRKQFAHVSPEFVIEVRSASDSLRELRAKMEMYLANGVALTWLVDPVRKAVEVYRPGQMPEVLEQPASVSGEGPVSGFVLELVRVWG